MKREGTGGEAPVVLVTGASGGLGSALVEAFAAAGWRVAAASRRPGVVGGEDRGNSILRVPMDVRDAGVVGGGVERVLAEWGRVDVLVNNAGVTRDALVSRMTDEDWDAVLGTHLKGAFHLARAVLPSMEARGTGHILSIASRAACAGGAGQSAYAAAKAALVGWSLALAREVGVRGIRVNVVFPGVMRTAMTQGIPEDRMGAYAGASVLGRINEPASVARQIVALAGPGDASGQVFRLDGRIDPWI